MNIFRLTTVEVIKTHRTTLLKLASKTTHDACLGIRPSGYKLMPLKETT